MIHKDKNEFEKWNNQVWDFCLPSIEGYKPLLVYKRSAILLDLSLKIQAYDFGILMQARADFKKGNLEGKSVKGFIRTEGQTYGKENIKQIAEQVTQYFKSSFDNDRAEKIKRLNEDQELMYLIPEDEVAISINEDFNTNWLTEYVPLRKEIAKKIQDEHSLSNNFVSDIKKLAFDEVVSLANRKTTFYPPDQAFAIKLINLVRSLEASITIYLVKFLQDLDLEGKEVSLLELRRSCKKRFNTVCWRCGRPLFKKDNKHYCTESEHRICYEARIKETKNSGFPEAIIRTKNHCDNCGHHPSPLNYIHKSSHIGMQMQFCSKKCWETFRKREYRKAKKSHS